MPHGLLSGSAESVVGRIHFCKCDRAFFNAISPVVVCLYELLKFFRDQILTPEQHIAVARQWAPIDINRFFKAVPGYPEIAEVRKEPEQTKNKSC